MATLAQKEIPSPPQRPLWLGAFILLGIGLYALLFGELFLRALKPQALIPRYVTGAPDGVRANLPNTRFRQWTPEVDVEIAYNDQGMRDNRPAPPLAKAPGECRIAILGDSFFVGFESHWADSYAMQLEQALADRGHRCRVLNFAVSGFGHAEMLVALESRVRAYAPDLVLASVHQTDGLDNLRSSLFTLGPDGQPVATGKPFLPGIAISDRLNSIALYRWVQENSHFYSAVRETIAVAVKSLLVRIRIDKADQDNAPRPAAPTADQPPAYVAHRGLNRALVQRMAADAGANGAPLLLLEIPVNAGNGTYLGVADNLLGTDLLDTIPTIRLTPRFEREPGRKLYLEQGHGHWTVRGNHLAADESAAFLVARNMLPPQSVDASVGSPSSTRPASS